MTLELTIQCHMSTNNSRVKQYIKYSPSPSVSTFFIAGIEIFTFKDEISVCLSLSFYDVNNMFFDFPSNIFKAQKTVWLDYKRILRASVFLEGKDRVYLIFDIMSGIID